MQNYMPILLVEDDRVDAMTVERALGELNVTNKIVRCEDGESALEYLNKPESKRPCVILLDLNMPKMGGIEFLKVIRNDDDLKKLPVIVMTTSQHESDVAESFELGVAGYVVKPLNYRKFVQAMKVIDMYWTLSKLPPVVELQRNG